MDREIKIPMTYRCPRCTSEYWAYLLNKEYLQNRASCPRIGCNGKLEVMVIHKFKPEKES